jgi:hypothetical protein
VSGPTLLGTDQGYVVVAHNARSENVVSEHDTYPEAKEACRSMEYRDETYYAVHGCCPKSMDPRGYCAGAL